MRVLNSLLALNRKPARLCASAALVRFLWALGHKVHAGSGSAHLGDLSPAHFAVDTISSWECLPDEYNDWGIDSENVLDQGGLPTIQGLPAGPALGVGCLGGLSRVPAHLPGNVGRAGATGWLAAMRAISSAGLPIHPRGTHPLPACLQVPLL